MWTILFYPLGGTYDISNDTKERSQPPIHSHSDLGVGGWEIYHRLLTTFSERLKNRGLGVALGMRGSQRILVLPTQHEVTKE